MALDQSYWSQSVVAEDSRGVEFCYIPTGRLLFGREKRLTEIKAPFYICKYPVTKAEFQEFIVRASYEFDDRTMALMDILAPYPDCPATPVSWWDAKQYVRWLRRETGDYYSLPFEWEWEYAARGPEAHTYPWGSAEPNEDRAHFSADMPQIQTASVSAHPMSASPFGCWGMAGNVWEWCLDTFDDDDEVHVLRGGSCADGSEACIALARRYCFPNDHRLNYAGFRLNYLPGEMFLEYRIAMMGEDQACDGTIMQG